MSSVYHINIGPRTSWRLSFLVITGSARVKWHGTLEIALRTRFCEVHLLTELVHVLKAPWPLVRQRSIPTDRLLLVDEILVPTFVDTGVSRGQRGGSPTVVNLSFLDRSRYFTFKYLLIYRHKG
jgi:hypothetical protein